MLEDSTKLPTSKANTAFILGIFAIMWGVFLLNQLTTAMGFDMNNYGIRPRTMQGLVGIFTSPVLHGDLQHILANSSASYFSSLANYYTTQNMALYTNLMVGKRHGTLGVWTKQHKQYRRKRANLCHGDIPNYHWIRQTGFP